MILPVIVIVMSDFSVPSWSKYVIGRYFEEDLKRLIWIKLETFRLKLVHALISNGQTYKYIFHEKKIQINIWPISCLNDSETQERWL